jgi:hypothetical protein
MGVDYYSYSNVRTEPIPSRFRPTKKVVNNNKQQNELFKQISEIPPELKPFILGMMGAQLGPNGLIIPDEIDILPEVRDEFYNTIGKEPDYIDVCWNTNIIYRSTPETKLGCASRSYSGYGEFCRDLDILNKHPMPYMPPDTDVAPEYGFISTDKCILCLQGLNQIRNHYVSPEWRPDPEKYGNSSEHRFNDDSIDKKDDIHGDSWFFREFYSMMMLGAESGFVRIS